MTEGERLYLSQFTPEERKEIRAAERRVIAEVRSCQRRVMKKREAIRKSMTEAEWRTYEDEQAERYRKEYGINLVKRRTDLP
jgi:hypothetical protein